MRAQPRPFAGLLLALLLGLTGQSMAVARGAPPPVGVMVLCTGAGPLRVLVDETGAPVGPMHICPDCALSLFDAAPAATPEGLTRAFTRQGRARSPGTAEAGRVQPARCARGPPARV